MKNILAGFGTVFVLLLVVAGLLLPLPGVSSQETTTASEDSGPMRTITVSGSNEISLKAEKVEVFLSVVTEAIKAKDSQEKNTVESAKVIAALVRAGVSKDDIETVSYNLQENRKWISTEKIYRTIGYKTINSIKISSENTGDAGKIIDAAISGGANQINRIGFSLKDQTIEKLKLLALANASEQTQIKSDTIANALGLQVKQLETINEQSVFYQPFYNSYKSFDMAESAVAGGVPTEILEGEISVSAQVSAIYSIE